MNYTIAETAKRLSISIDSVYRLVRGGKLTASKRLGQWVVSRDAVRARLRAKSNGVK